MIKLASHSQRSRPRKTVYKPRRKQKYEIEFIDIEEFEAKIRNALQGRKYVDNDEFIDNEYEE